MFVYDIGIVDFFQGMTELSDYIKLCEKSENSYFYHDLHSLKRLLIKFFIHIKSHETYWEGDINVIGISAVPRHTADCPKVFICFKQNNNGSSFLVSEAEFNFTKNDMYFGDIILINKLRHLTSEILIKYFDQSHKLVEQIFDDALNEKKSKATDRIIEDKHHEKVAPINENKFDKSNYIQL